ncbi:MAG: hypothetical protein SVY53_10810 [Chloroflexota bacterium]|nr:hypothetical protein [Chloroflexota bacterium]
MSDRTIDVLYELTKAGGTGGMEDHATMLERGLLLGVYHMSYPAFLITCSPFCQ